MARLSILCALVLLVAFVQAKPPQPPRGYKWVRNWALSDEFNGNSLNKNKWTDYHRFWGGRRPTLFTRSAVSVRGGYLRITSSNRKNYKDGYRIAGGAVMSKGYTASFGYYETSMKASNIRMSSSFWMQNKGHLLHATKNCTRDRYMLELDVVEAVGGFNGYQAKYMVANTHYRHRACNPKNPRGKPMKEKFYSRGASMRVKGYTRDRFNTYGAWWKDGNKVTFYLNDKEGKTVMFKKDIDPTAPFDKPQALIFSTCTYHHVKAPTVQELKNAQKSTALWDWVRSWKLVRKW